MHHTNKEDAAKIQRAAQVVAVDPQDQNYQTTLATHIGTSLQSHTPLAQELLDILGEEGGLQEILADKDSWVENVRQEVQGKGDQRVRANQGSVIKGVKQKRVR